MQSEISIEPAKYNGSDGEHRESQVDEIESNENIDDLPLWSPRIVHIRATITQLDEPVVPFAVLKYDPCASESFEQEQRPDQARSIDAIREWWNAPMRSLPPERCYFLLAWSAIEGASPRIVPVAGLTFGIATPGPSYKRWITSCALECRGELVAWCEEIDMTGEQKDIIEVVLSEESMIRLMPGHAAGRASKVA